MTERSPAVIRRTSSVLMSAVLFLLLSSTGGLCKPGGRAQSLPEPIIAEQLEVDGGRIYYQVFGEGYPLVLVHDGLAHSEIWDQQVAEYAPHYRVIRYDRRGYGRSEQPKTQYSHVEDLRAVVNALDIERAVFMGISAGGGLCIDFTLTYPELVEALVLSGPVVSGLGYTYHFMERAYANFAPDMETTLELWAEDTYSIAAGNDDARELLRNLLTENPHNLDFAKHQLLKIPDRPALERLDEIRVPTLLLTGEHDIPDVHAHMGAIEAGIAGTRRVVLSDAGHLPCLEQPDQFNHAVTEFLSLLSLDPESPRLAEDPASPWDSFQNGLAPVAGTALYYENMNGVPESRGGWGRRDACDGIPVILIHGGAIDHRMWDDQFAALARQCRVIRYDVRGHGLSLSPWGFYCNYEDLRALMTHLGIEKAHLIGLSMGCRIAVDLAISHPEQVASLILCSPGVSGYDFDSPEEQEYMQRIGAAWGSGDFAQAAEEFVRGWTDGPKRTPDQVPTDVRTKIKRMALETLRPDRDIGRGRELDPPAIGRLSEITAPTLVILGDLDMPGIHEIVSMLGKHVDGARVERIEGVAHMVNMEESDRFLRLVLDFLPANGRAR